jgi:hypothetical protein
MIKIKNYFLSKKKREKSFFFAFFFKVRERVAGGGLGETTHPDVRVHQKKKSDKAGRMPRTGSLYTHSQQYGCSHLLRRGDARLRRC